MTWLILFLAGLFEVVWAIGLKYTHGFTRLVPSVITVAGTNLGTNTNEGGQFRIRIPTGERPR